MITLNAILELNTRIILSRTAQLPHVRFQRYLGLLHGELIFFDKSSRHSSIRKCSIHTESSDSDQRSQKYQRIDSTSFSGDTSCVVDVRYRDKVPSTEADV
jgi:hypothetical protein